MTDFTLVIPTYNRPRQLAALANYLRNARVPWDITVLNSGAPAEINFPPSPARLLHIGTVPYPQDTHPFDKFADGVSRVTTPYCMLCADDDLVIPASIERCLELLRERPEFVAAQGMGFSFLGTEFGGILRPAVSIIDNNPMARVAKLMGDYRALTYAVYRTDVLKWVLSEAKYMDSLLAKELLAGNLTAVRGRIASMPCFTSGRSSGASAHRYFNWHPFEWFAQDADTLMKAYKEYRDWLANAIFDSQENNLNARSIEQALDLVHLHYLLTYAKRDVLDFLIEGKCQGKVWNGWPEELQNKIAEAHTADNPLVSSDAIGEIMKCLREYGEAMVDTSSKDEHSSAEAEA